jgi:hypothetical protein
MIQKTTTETQDIEISTTEIDKIIITEEILIIEIIGRIGTNLEAGHLVDLIYYLM